MDVYNSGTLQMWSMEHRALMMVASYKDEKVEPSCLAFDPQGRYLAQVWRFVLVLSLILVFTFVFLLVVVISLLLLPIIMLVVSIEIRAGLRQWFANVPGTGTIDTDQTVPQHREGHELISTSL